MLTLTFCQHFNNFIDYGSNAKELAHVVLLGTD